MKHNLIASVLLSTLALVSFAIPAYADSCASVKREMTYGRVALQDAKEKQDFLESAKQFKVAVDKAPDCASAHFNLGVVLGSRLIQIQ